jgi:hypothetical protein
MGLLSWIILLAVAAALATAVQFLLFRHDRKATDYDRVYIAGGALLGGFTAHVWYPVGPLVDGLYLLPALVGEVVLGTVAQKCSTAHLSDYINPHIITTWQRLPNLNMEENYTHEHKGDA